MGLRTSAPVAETPKVISPKQDNAPVSQNRDKGREVKGQVAMHAIITGYEVASHLAATLAGSPDKVEEKLHKLAHEVAAQVEAYTFKGE